MAHTICPELGQEDGDSKVMLHPSAVRLAHWTFALAVVLLFASLAFYFAWGLATAHFRRRFLLQTSYYVARHVCVEGWTMIGRWGGVPLCAFLERVGADTRTRYVAFRCADPIDYTGSIDMASALHPQTILCITQSGEPLESRLGAPMRLRMAAKLGFKQPKRINSPWISNDDPGGHWEDLSYNWFSGI